MCRQILRNDQWDRKDLLPGKQGYRGVKQVGDTGIILPSKVLKKDLKDK